jgi:multidrug resistance efflux pump
MALPSSSSNRPDDGDNTPAIWSWREAYPSPTAADEASAHASHRTLRDLHTSALQAAETPRMARWVMLGSLGVLVALALALVFVPWQQTVSGSGEVTTFAPGARPQSVEAQISARIRSWRVNEGETVAAGDTIAVLEDISTSYMDDRFVERIATSRANELRVLQLEAERARQSLAQAQQRRRAAEAALENATLEVATARKRYNRVKALYDEGLTSLRAFESEELALRKARSDSVAAASDLEAARQAVESARLEVDRKESALESRRAELDLRLENAQERQKASVVQAPIAGTIARVNKAGPGQTVKEGSELARIVPTTDDQAAEIFVSSVDAAIVEPGRRVQLQFAGFPALQFSGFPEASFGVFSGRVRVVSPVADSAGRYRLLVVPDTTGGRPEWPSDDYLRQGSAVTGWVMLSDVSLGYEIWRRINGLPPQVPVRNRTTAR